jgi:hypothetical protein
MGSFDLRRLVGRRDGDRSERSASLGAALLHYVHQLVDQEALTVAGGGRVASRGERDVLADRVGVCGDCANGLSGPGIVMNANSGEVVAEARLRDRPTAGSSARPGELSTSPTNLGAVEPAGPRASRATVR